MFTGLVEELGTVKSLIKGKDSGKLTVEAKKILEGVKLGDSIAVNGVCLTVVAFDRQSFQVDIMSETLKKSNLGQIQPGEKVNLERALCLGDRLGGHLVSGHIDGTGTIEKQETIDIAVVTTIKAPRTLLKYIIDKGSIAVDGISLTVIKVTDENFSLSLIPHTAKETTLGHKKKGDTVNLECDLVGKYLERFWLMREGEKKEGPGGISSAFLAEHGFF